MTSLRKNGRGSRLSKQTGYSGSRRKVSHYGWLPDLPDPRDHTYAAPQRSRAMALALGAGGAAPPVDFIDLRNQCPLAYSQGRIGSCTANAIAGALEFCMMKEGQQVFTPSRLFIYYNERSIEGKVLFDAGAFLRDGIKSVASEGDCPETLWTYDDTPPAVDGGAFLPGAKAATQPDQRCYDEAKKHEALTYLSISQNLADMKSCLAEGFPFVFCFTVFPSFESDAVARGDNAGWVPLHGPEERTIGGHAVLAVGYSDEDQVFICRNSWGTGWGDNGYFFMPYAYLLDDNLSDDFWTIRLIG